LDKVSVLLATSQKGLAQSLQTVLEHEDWIQVVGSSASRDETLELAKSLTPQVVVIDYELAGDGLETGRRILKVSPEVRIIVLSVYDYVGQVTVRSATAKVSPETPKEAPAVVESVEWLSKKSSLAQLLDSISSAGKKHRRLH
jgi:DNA-binding NarL/FixJ family response regulator